jgi:hypothetical protein
VRGQTRLQRRFAAVCPEHRELCCSVALLLCCSVALLRCCSAALLRCCSVVLCCSAALLLCRSFVLLLSCCCAAVHSALCSVAPLLPCSLAPLLPRSLAPLLPCSLICALLLPRSSAVSQLRSHSVPTSDTSQQTNASGRDAFAESIFAGEGKEEVSGYIEGFLYRAEGGEEADARDARDAASGRAIDAGDGVEEEVRVEAGDETTHDESQVVDELVEKAEKVGLR